MKRLWLVGLAALQTAAAQTAFEAASVRPSPTNDARRANFRFLPGGGVSFVGIPLYMIIAVAHNVPYQSQTARLTGGPDWVRSARFDIEAKAPADSMKGLSATARVERTRAMLKALLADRFQLRTHRETREQPVYALSVAKGGLKLKASAFTEADCPDDGSCHQLTGGQGRGLHGKAVNLSDITAYLENWTDRSVVNRTGLPGLFDIDTDPWASVSPPGVPPGPPLPEPGTASVNDPVRPSLFTVLARVGLRLEAAKGMMNAFVIERVEPPARN